MKKIFRNFMKICAVLAGAVVLIWPKALPYTIGIYLILIGIFELLPEK